MSTFPRKWFNSTTNWFKANNLCGHSKTINLSDVLVDGELKFEDSNSNFNKLIWNVETNYVGTDDVVDFQKITISKGGIQVNCKEIINMSIDTNSANYYAIVNSNSPTVEKVHITKVVGTISQSFRQLPNVTEIIIDDASQMKTDEAAFGDFSYNPKLLKLELNGFKGSDFNLTYYQYSPITNEQKYQLLVGFFNSLGKLDEGVTYSIIIGSGLLGLLTEEDIKIATDKGWTLA